MPTPPKPHLVLMQEKKSHRTKAELEQRKQGELALTTGVHMRIWPEVATDAIAKKEFNRVKNLLKKIGKDDALHEGVVNRYALLRAECVGFETARNQAAEEIEGLKGAHAAGEIDFLTYLDNVQKTRGVMVALDRQIQAKRKMLLDIEKENIMTIASALRSIPKKVEKSKDSGIAGFMKNRAGGSGD